jgi:hypothetical protein
MTTIVTALYDINRDNIDNRKFDEYINWIQKTLELNTNFIVFTESKVLPYLPKQKNIYIVETSLEEIPLFFLNDSIEKILSDKDYLSKIDKPERIECRIPLYNIIQYSKFKWLQKAIDINYFNSDYFFWMDAGCSRFFNKADISQNFPNLNKINSDKLIIQGNINTNHTLIDENYIWKSDCVLVGTLFGGHKNIVNNISNKVLQFFSDVMIKNKQINNEQIALAYVAIQNLDLFDVYIKIDNTHLPLFQYLVSYE